MATATAIAAMPETDDSAYFGPVDESPINYLTAPLHDPISQLQRRINAGEVKLEHDPRRGYLPALLKALDVPVSSQVLVFSKTSFQNDHISPRTPRAVYFGGNAYVGTVQGGPVLEVASVDPAQGTIFYTLSQTKKDKPRFERNDQQCLTCHQSRGTLGVPGPVVRSVFPDSSGFPLLNIGSYITTHRSPLIKRWGGWYVTGTHGEQQHMGNLIVSNTEDPESMLSQAGSPGSNITDLSSKIDVAAYLSPHSDIVALLVLEHQTRMQNLYTRASFEERLARTQQRTLNEALKQKGEELSDGTRQRLDHIGEMVVRYMFMVDETNFTDHIKGTSTFADDFEAVGPRDRAGRSLRELDLHRYLFKYSLSFTIYSEQFDSLTPYMKSYVWRRIGQVLTGKDKSDDFSMSTERRAAILEILRETKKGLPAELAAK